MSGQRRLRKLPPRRTDDTRPGFAVALPSGPGGPPRSRPRGSGPDALGGTAWRWPPGTEGWFGVSAANDQGGAAMALRHEEAKVGDGGEGVARAVPEDDRPRIGPRLTSEEVWQALAKASFAVLGYVTPTGEPRSSGVVYKTIGRRLYVAVAPDSWKARQIAASRQVAVTVPVRRGGILSLVAPIPPATVSFHATAIVHPAGSLEVGSLS